MYGLMRKRLEMKYTDPKQGHTISIKYSEDTSINCTGTFTNASWVNDPLDVETIEQAVESIRASRDLSVNPPRIIISEVLLDYFLGHKPEKKKQKEEVFIFKTNKEKVNG